MSAVFSENLHWSASRSTCRPSLVIGRKDAPTLVFLALCVHDRVRPQEIIHVEPILWRQILFPRREVSVYSVLY